MEAGIGRAEPQAPWDRAIELEPGRYKRLAQIVGRVNRAEGDDPLSTARAVTLDWLRTKKRWKISDSQAISDRPVQIEDDASTRALAIESSPGLWAIRCDDPCTEVAGRQWRVELVLADMGPDRQPAVACTLSAFVPAGVDSTISNPAVPAVVGMLAQQAGLEDAGRALDGQPWEVDAPRDLDNLIQIIESKMRSVSVIVASTPRNGTTLIEPQRLARQFAGLAIVAVVSPDAAQDLTLRYGRGHGVFGDAIRIYRVGFDPDVDDRFRHPLYVGQSWRHRLATAQKQMKFVAMSDTVDRRDGNKDLPSFALIRGIAADRRLRSAITGPSLPETSTQDFAADIAVLRDAAQGWERMALDEEQRAQAAEEAKRQAQARLYAYTGQIRRLEEELNRLRAAPPLDFTRPVDELEEWAEENFTGRLIITPKASRAAASVPDYADPELLLRCCALLAQEYWEMKVTGGADQLAKCRAKEAELGVRISPTGEAVDTRQYAGEYRVSWEGTTYKLDMHVAGSDSRDRRQGLRIYFSWDDQQQLVIVGHLPTHLTSTHT